MGFQNLRPQPSQPYGISIGKSMNYFSLVLKTGKQNQAPIIHLQPALVLDDSCIIEHDFNISLMGKVKDVTVIPKLYIILAKEAFQNLNITYLGGLWVLIELDSLNSCEKFNKHVGVG